MKLNQVVITIDRTEYCRMPNSINNHTMKYFQSNNILYCIDKETDCNPPAYRLYEVGNGMILDYFADGYTWSQAISFVEGFLTCRFGKQENQ